MPEIYPRDHVLAQRAYSELNSLEQGEKYARFGIPRELKEKQAHRHPFGELDQSERKLLIKAWYGVRGPPGTIFFRALDSVSAFQLKHWTKHDLEPVCIIRHFYHWLAPAYQSRRVTFKEWIEADPYGELSQHHPLREAGGSTFTQDDPVTVGPLQRIISLLDGYHRAVRFWRTKDAELLVYVPYGSRRR